MAARIVLVSGANQGIGFATVKRLCKEHPSWIVYGTSRKPAAGEEACKKLRDEGCENARFLTMDLRNEASITETRDYLVKEHGGLDVLVNNAGMAFKAAATDPHAHKVEVTLATNVFGTGAVLKHLMPILRDGARIAILSSLIAPMALHKVQKLAPERYERYIKSDPPLTLEQVYGEMREYQSSVKAGDFAAKGWPDDAAYSVSKLANTLMARAISYELQKTPERDIVCNAVDPGYVSTNMSSYKGHLTIDEGADCSYYAASLPAGSKVTGEHLSKREVVAWK